jgi:beta-xylosidase
MNELIDGPRYSDGTNTFYTSAMTSFFVYLTSFLAAAQVILGFPSSKNMTYVNPAIPGWHSDPSCIFVPELDDTFFCVTSTFLLTPGLPIHASKDLVNWKLASHAINRPSQYPWYSNATRQSNGIFAATLRYRDDTFYLITFFVSTPGNSGYPGMLFKTKNPYDNSAWSDPILFPATSIDPDLFWDDDGQAYVAVAGVSLSTFDVATGTIGTAHSIWNGTGGASPEGPHIYKKDGWYYLLIAEGGTEVNHAVTMARSKNVTGPYVGYEHNPVLTNRGTDEYFQTVGHADVFHDANGNWWTCALSTRSGPEWKNFPMGRETVITAARWDKGEFPVMTPVQGVESVWRLPTSKSLPGNGPFIGEPDVINFEPGSSLPPQLSFWRWPDANAYTISPKGHPNTLALKPSKDITSGSAPITVIMRVQTDTLFDFSVNVDFSPKIAQEEAGVTVFLNQAQHLDLGIVLLPQGSSNSSRLVPQLRFRITGTGNLEGAPPAVVTEPIPHSWLGHPITLEIQAKNDTHYQFSAGKGNDKKILGLAPATIVSGGQGQFTGMLSVFQYFSLVVLVLIIWDRCTCGSLCYG